MLLDYGCQVLQLYVKNTCSYNVKRSYILGMNQVFRWTLRIPAWNFDSQIVTGLGCRSELVFGVSTSHS